MMAVFTELLKLVALLGDEDPAASANKLAQRERMRTEQRCVTEVLREELGLQLEGCSSLNDDLDRSAGPYVIYAETSGAS
jgi:hypothetical protein